MTVPAHVDPIEEKGDLLARMIIKDLALREPIPTEVRDDVYTSLATNVRVMLEQHSIVFSGMASRITVHSFLEFTSVASELFEATENAEPRVTWGRIVSLFAFTVRFAQEYRSNPNLVAGICSSLCLFLRTNIVPYVRSQGGWEGILAEFPPPSNTESVIKNSLLCYLGVAVGLAATVLAVKRLMN